MQRAEHTGAQLKSVDAARGGGDFRMGDDGVGERPQGEAYCRDPRTLIRVASFIPVHDVSQHRHQFRRGVDNGENAHRVASQPVPAEQ